MPMLSIISKPFLNILYTFLFFLYFHFHSIWFAGPNSSYLWVVNVVIRNYLLKFDIGRQSGREKSQLNLWWRKVLLTQHFGIKSKSRHCVLRKDISECFWQPVQPLMMPVRPGRLSTQPEDSCLSSCQLENNEGVSLLLLMLLWISPAKYSFICPLPDWLVLARLVFIQYWRLHHL